MSLEELQREWTASLAGTPAVDIAPDPGTIGTAAIIVGAVAFAAVASGVGWLLGRRRPREEEVGSD